MANIYNMHDGIADALINLDASSHLLRLCLTNAGGCYSEYHQVAPDNRSGGLRSLGGTKMCEKAWSRSWSRSSEPACAGLSEDGAIKTCPDDGFSSEGRPSDETIRSSLTDVRGEIERARRLVRSLEGSPEGAFTCALGALAALERRIVALEKESQETVRSPETSDHVVQKIAELRESLEDKSPQGTKSSSSKEEEYVLVAPIRGIDEDGRLILGDRKIVSASALKI